MTEDLVIIGAGGFGREIAWLVDDINADKRKWNLLGFVDEDKSKQGLLLNDYPVMGFDQMIGRGNEFFAAFAVGNPKTKKLLVEKFAKDINKFANLIHPSVIMSKHFRIGTGNIICAGNIITVNIEIGNHVIINLDCTVGHDVTINDYCTLAPSVNVSGKVTLSEGCDLGTNATIIQGKRIGKWSTIGAGAVVINDLPPYCTAVGIPAEPIKHEK